MLTISHVILTRWCWSGIPLQIDTGMWAYIGGRILDGALPYRDLWDQKPPGIFYLFAALQWTFGRSIDHAFHILDAFVTLTTCILSFALACRLTARSIHRSIVPSAAAFAALLLCILLGHRTLADWGSNVEKFVVLFELAALLFLIRGSASAHRTSVSLLAGLCCGLAGFFKQPAILLPLTITTVALIHRHRDAPTGTLPIRLLPFWLGIALPWLPVLIAFSSAGIVDDFLRDVVLYDFRRVGGSSAERSRLLGLEHWSAVWANLKLAAILLAPAALALIVRRPAPSPPDAPSPAALIRRIVAAQFLLTTIIFLIAPYGYGHYLLHTAPYAAIIVASWLVELCSRARLHSGEGEALLCPHTAVTVAAMLISIWPLLDHFEFTLNPDSEFRMAYQSHAARQRAMIDLLRRESRQGDDVMIWPPDQAVSWYAARRTPLEISNLPIVYKGKIDRLTPPMDAILERLRADPPALILDWTPIDVDRSTTPPELLVPMDGSSLLEAPNDHHPMPTGRAFAPLKRWLRDHYAARRAPEGFIIYERNQPWRDWQGVLFTPPRP